MLISEIKKKYPLLYERIEKYRDTSTTDGTISGAFMWDMTDEGHDFWLEVSVSAECIPPAVQEMQPHLFEECTDPSPLEKTQNTSFIAEYMYTDPETHEKLYQYDYPHRTEGGIILFLKNEDGKRKWKRTILDERVDNE